MSDQREGVGLEGTATNSSVVAKLLENQSFLAVCLSQVLGAFNGNLLKYATLAYITFSAQPELRDRASQLAAMAAAAILLPSIGLGGIAGQITDTRDRAKLLRWIKILEIAAILFVVAGSTIGSVTVLLTAMFMVGLHATLSASARLAILSNYIPPRKLPIATGLIEGGTVLAVIAGQIMGYLLRTDAVLTLALALGLAGLIMVVRLPRAPPPQWGQLDFNVLRSTRVLFIDLHQRSEVWRAILGMSWFFGIGAVLLSQMPIIVKLYLDGGRLLIVLVLVIFFAGFLFGSVIATMLCRTGKLLSISRGGYVLLCAFLFDTFLTLSHIHPLGVQESVDNYLGFTELQRLLADFWGIAFAGAFIVVSLSAHLQRETSELQRVRVIAANNIVRAGVSAASLLAYTAAIWSGASQLSCLLFVTTVTAILAVANIMQSYDKFRCNEVA